MKKDMLRRLQLTQLEILIAVDDAFKEHNLRYYLLGGTLLGAVRHKGFIPWDDDIDIAMKREDYDKLIKLYKENKISFGIDYSMQNYETDKSVYFMYTKIIKKNTRLIELSESKKKIDNYIFIDVFPLDSLPNNSLISFIQGNLIKIMQYSINIRRIGKSFNLNSMKRLLILPILFLINPIPVAFLYKLHAFSCNLFNYGHGFKFITNFMGAHGYKKEAVECEWFDDITMLEFENRLFPAPSHYHEYLAKLYGNYMKLPPKRKRTGHSITKVHF